MTLPAAEELRALVNWAISTRRGAFSNPNEGVLCYPSVSPQQHCVICVSIWSIHSLTNIVDGICNCILHVETVYNVNVCVQAMAALTNSSGLVVVVQSVR